MKTLLSVILLSILCLYLITSCKTDPPALVEYTIEGSIDSTFNGKTIYLTDQGAKRTIDSTIVDSGKFVFKGMADTVRFCSVNLERQHAKFILEEGKITVDMEKHNATGTPLNETFAKYTQLTDSMQKLSYNNYMTLKEQIKDPVLLKKQLDSVYNNSWQPAYNKILDNALEANANNVISMVVASDLSRSSSVGKMDTIFSKLSADIKEKPMVKRLIDRNDSLKKTAVGQKFTDFTITQEDSTKVSLSDYAGKGKYVLVDFWASWCGPCRGEVPNLKELYSKYKGDKFEIVGVAVWDQLDKSKKIMKEDKMTWPQILNAGEIPTKIYGITGIPHIMLIGPDGTIVARELRGDAMKEKVKEVLSK